MITRAAAPDIPGAAALYPTQQYRHYSTTPPYTSTFSSAMSQQSPPPMPSSAGRLLQPAFFRRPIQVGEKDKPFPVPCDVHSLRAMMRIPIV